MSEIKAAAKKLTPGVNAAKKEISIYKLMLNANKAIKNEIYSLSGAIKQFNVLSGNDSFLKATKVKKENVTPDYVLKNIVNVPNFKAVKNEATGRNEIFFTCTIKGVKTDKMKSKWSPFNVLQSIYYAK